MPLLKDGHIVDDPWVRIDDETQPPAAVPVIVGLERWLDDHGRLREHDAALGIALTSDQSVSVTSLKGCLDGLALIALDFPAFTDGRAFSAARVLRSRFGFAGEVRATGNVLRDQYGFMLRCGFDAFEVPADTVPEDWRAAAEAISEAYQPAADGIRTIWARRHGAAA